MSVQQSFTKTCLYNFDHLKPHLYVVELGFTWVYIIFLIYAQIHRLWYSLEPPRRGGSNEYPQSMFWAEIWKNIRIFSSENFHFSVVNFSVYLKRHFFVMDSDQPAHLECRWCKISSRGQNNSDQTAHIRRLICAFFGRIGQNARCLTLRLKCLQCGHSIRPCQRKKISQTYQS